MVVRAGRAELRPLAWDTDFFGATMGAIALVGEGSNAPPAEQAERLRGDLSALLEQARALGYAHLIFRAPADDTSSIWAAEGAGLRLVDVGIDSTFVCERTALPQSPPAVIRPVREDDLPALRELAAVAFVFSRFATDPFFTAEQVADFHREWITNLCRGLAQAVLVCEAEGGPAGFVSCAMTHDEGRIPLIATDGSHRYAGLGRALVGAALHWFVAAGARVVHVKTQAHNYPALGLYHRSGFVVSKAELTFSVALGAGTTR